MEEIWTTANGRKYKVKDMATSHIRNCINCINDGRITSYKIIKYNKGDRTMYKRIDCPEETENWLCIFINELNRRSLEQFEEKTKKYKLFIRKYNIIKNDYVVEEKIVETDDIYHEIGYIYCTTLEDIKRIDYKVLNEV